MASLQKTSYGQDKRIPAWIGGPAERPAVIVLQEWWGITPEIKAQAEYISQQGNYRVLLPDLYKGKVGVDAEEASHLSDGLDFKQASEEVNVAAEWLRQTGAPKVGSIGFCMGGSLSLIAAEHAKINAAVSFYGTPSNKKDLSHPEAIKAPVQLHGGQEDSMKGMSDPETVTKFAEDIRKANGSAELFIYPGEAHAFMNAGEDAIKRMSTAGIPAGKKESQDLAWERVLKFFKAQLG